MNARLNADAFDDAFWQGYELVEERVARIYRAGIAASVALGLPIVADPNPMPRFGWRRKR